MAEGFDFGPRLSDEEYDRSVVELQANLPPMQSREQERQLRRQELELAINHRLGIEFPKARRDALWAVKERIERKRMRLSAKYFVRRLFGRAAIPKGLAEDAQGLAGIMVDAFAEVLDENELRSFFDLEKGEKPSLPIPNEVK